MCKLKKAPSSSAHIEFKYTSKSIVCVDEDIVKCCIFKIQIAGRDGGKNNFIASKYLKEIITTTTEVFKHTINSFQA